MVVVGEGGGAAAAAVVLIFSYWFCIAMQRLATATASSDLENLIRSSSSSGLQAAGALDPTANRFKNIASKFQKLINRDR